ncbi:MAG: GntR family transcriptional regulator [Bacillota bacterium]|nr:GntR family transcriptional regulator [Bacillota bacterium]
MHSLSATACGSIRELLLMEMREGEFAQAQRLPSENVLAERLGISRTQLRDSLASLEREGFISRLHGVGTVVNRHVLDVDTRMDLEAEFAEMLRRAGYQPAIAFAEAQEQACDRLIAQRLHIAEGGRVLCVARLVTADGRPAIYCEDYIEYGRIKDASYGDADLIRPIFDFLERFCFCQPVMDLTELHAAAADSRLAALLQVAEGAPLLYMDEVDYDTRGEPLFCSRQYYVEGILKHTVLRKKI